MVEITKNLGAFGKSSGIDITKMDCSKNYIVCRIEKFVEYKHQFYYLTEFQDEGVLSVYAENTFESFAEKGKMTYAKGNRNIPLSKVHETFGV